MSRHRLFCSRKRLVDGLFTVTGEEGHHGVTVCRLRAGDEVYIFTEQGSEFRCEVASTGKGRLQARIVEKLDDEVESPLELTLIQGVPKAAKLEQIIVHATEMGLTRLVLAASERSFAGERLERWRRLALEAAKQSGRRKIPLIEPALPLEEVELGRFEGALKLLACERPCAGSLKRIVGEQEGIEAVAIAAGPEGGFTESEMSCLLAGGFLCVSMGPRVLRAETASLALMAAVQCLLGDWEPRGGERQCRSRNGDSM